MPTDDRLLGAGVLARMQNGTLGEARTRAFLANRFWVLDRSVDVHGADFLIQVNSLTTSVLDTRPPRFAIVQAKFVQARTTSIRIPQSYLRKEDDSVSKEFFLIICTGYGDGERMFLLDAGQIDQAFDTSVNPETNAVTRTKSAADFLDGTNYEITKARNHALDRIERSLREASYTSNRLWVSGLGYGPPAPATIDELYHYPVVGYDDLPKMFAQWKKEAFSAQSELEWVTHLLQEGLDATDPSALEKVTRQLWEYIGDGRFSIQAPKSMDEFYDFAEFHRRLVEKLKAENLEGAWLALVEHGQRLKEEAAMVPAEVRGPSVRFTVDYDPVTLKIAGFQWANELGADRMLETFEIDPKSEPGHVSIRLRGDIAYETPAPATYLSQLTSALSHAILPARFGVPDLDSI